MQRVCLLTAMKGPKHKLTSVKASGIVMWYRWHAVCMHMEKDLSANYLKATYQSLLYLSNSVKVIFCYNIVSHTQ